MRKLLTLTVIVAVFILGSIWVQDELSRSSRAILNQLSSVTELIEAKRWSQAVSAFDHVKSEWSSVEKWWALVTDHEEIDEISRSIHKASAYLANEDISSAQAELSALTYLIGHIPQKERLTLTTLF